MNIYLYRIVDKPTALQKNTNEARLVDYITDYKLIGGANVTDLTISLRHEGGYYPRTPNYCYIPELHRYYFIKSYNIVNNNMYTFRLHCDVLMTYKELLTAEANQYRLLYVKRTASENIEQNYLNDDLLAGDVRTETTDTEIVTSYINSNASGLMLAAITAKADIQ